MKLEKTFYMDAMRNYMILKGPEGEAKNGYQYRILSANTIERMLPCSVRFIDNTCLLYYDVTSMQALSVLYETRKIGFAALREILTGLMIAQEKLAAFLLDSRRMVYDPECIFYDFDKKEYQFAYYPEDLEGNDCGRLYSFIAEHVDTFDEPAVTVAYELTDVAMAQDGFLLTEKYLHRLLVGTEYRTETGTGTGQLPHREENNTVSAQEAQPQPQKSATRAEKWQAAMSSSAAAAASPKPNRKGEMRSGIAGSRETLQNGGIRIVAAGAFSVGMILFVLRYALKTAGQTDSMFRTVIVASMTVSVLLYLYSLAGSLMSALHTDLQHTEFRYAGRGEAGGSRNGSIRGYAGSARSMRNQDAAAEEEDEEEARYAKLRELEMEFGAGSMGSMDERPLKDRTAAAGSITEATAGATVSTFTATAEEEPGSDGKVLRLYGLGDARKYHIHLDELPLTVGSMREFSDVSLADSTVSRLHVRFFEDGGEVFMTDLNSLYGTSLNGERLEPNETVKILPQDEIRIGRLEFRCR